MNFLKNLLKNKWTYIILGVVVLGWFFFGRGGSNSLYYETAKAQKGDLVRTVEVTGEVKPDLRLSLGFKSSGTLNRVNVKVGQTVKRGDLLAELESRDLRFSAERAGAALAISQANLNARLAGETKETIEVAQASVDQAKASYDKSLVDLDLTKQSVEDEYRLAQIAYDKAASDVSSGGATADQSVISARVNLVSAMKASLGAMRSGLSAGDEIIGVDNAAANDNYENVLGISDVTAKETAKYQYESAKLALKAAEAAITALVDTNPATTYIATGEKTQDALEKTQAYLDSVQRVLNASITNAYLTDALLSSKRSAVDAQRSAVSAQLTSVSAAVESYRTATYSVTTSKTQLEATFKQAEANLAIADRNRTNKVKTAETNVLIQKAALNSAQANLDARKAGPRAVDVAGLRASVLDAQTAYNQASERLADAQIVAPADGVITDIVPTTGELVNQNAAVIRMVSTEGYGIEALVPESDITIVEPGQSVTITLDAYGDNVKFTGKIVGENADQTKVQDAIYYKVYATIDIGDKDVKPGMTANLTITTASRTGVLYVPSRSLRDADGKKEVRMIKGTTVQNASVEAGLRADDSKSEIIKGLAEGDRVILREATADEYAKLPADSRFEDKGAAKK